MSDIGDAIRGHHRELAGRLSAYATDLEEHRPGADAEALVTFLRAELLPHAQGEERMLYPALDPIIKEYGTPTATMRGDHEFIGDSVRQIDDIARALRSASGAERPALERQLRRVVTQLDGLFRVHLAKEERVYLPLFEEHASRHEQRRILEGMHETPPAREAPDDPAAAVTLDVRAVPPAQRHPMIFDTFAGLFPGASFILVNDHDPKPLYHQLNAEHPGQLVWEYLERGPETWRVRVGKPA